MIMRGSDCRTAFAYSNDHLRAKENRMGRVQDQVAVANYITGVTLQVTGGR